MLLGLPEAQTGLRLLPASLLDVAINTPVGIVDDPAWKRLRCLRTLELCQSESTSAVLLRGCEMAGLTALASLTFQLGQANIIAGEGLMQPSITALTFNLNPFEGRLRLEKLPALAKIHVASDVLLPSWLAGQPLSVLMMHSSPQLAGVPLVKLQITHLHVVCSEGGPTWRLADLLRMLPNLRMFVTEPNTWLVNAHPLQLKGSRKEYLAALSTLRLSFDYPVQLHASAPGYCTSCVSLLRNGHTVVCTCPDCQ